MSTTYSDLQFTNFPESIDTFVEMLDIVASDATSLKAYQDAMASGNVTAANNALATMADGARKILTADKINKIFDSIEALERFLASDIVPYISNLQSQWNTKINNFTYKGAYSSSTTYKTNNIVSYEVENGNFLLYLCIKDSSAGIPVTNTTYWLQFTIIGARGASGAGFSYCYEWDSSTQYSMYDCVSYGGKLWYARRQSRNNTPSSSSSYWIEVMSISPAKYPVQSIMPAGQEVNDLWFQTIGSAF